jgi:hypothetical protein
MICRELLTIVLSAKEEIPDKAQQIPDALGGRLRKEYTAIERCDSL